MVANEMKMKINQRLVVMKASTQYGWLARWRQPRAISVHHLAGENQRIETAAAAAGGESRRKLESAGIDAQIWRRLAKRRRLRET